MKTLVKGAVVQPEDRVGFRERMLYTAEVNETTALIYNDHSYFILLLWLHKSSI